MSKESFLLGRLFLLFLGVTVLVLRIYKRVIFKNYFEYIGFDSYGFFIAIG